MISGYRNIHNNGLLEKRVNRKKMKLSRPWTSNIPKMYKRNTVKAKLYQAKRISLSFTNEVTLITNELKSTGYPFMCLDNSVIRTVTIAQANNDIEFIIPSWLFEVKKKIVLARIPYCLKNKSSSK